MDGVSKAKLQESIGVRAIVQDIDTLRIKLGFDNVTVLTPIVEVRLRSAVIAQKPLRLICTISDTIKLDLTFPPGYPKLHLIVAVTDFHDIVIDNLTISLQEYCQSEKSDKDFNSESENVVLEAKAAGIYPKAGEVILFLKQILEEAAKQLKDTDQYGLNDVENDINRCNTNDIHNLNNIINDELENMSIKPDILCSENGNEDKNEDENDIYYSCMKCSCFLFNNNEIEKHIPCQKDIDRRKGLLVPCSSLFLSAMPTCLQGINTSENSFKILCPKCSNKLGLGCWTGSQCSCGQWITPSFQFINSKIDMKTRKPYSSIPIPITEKISDAEN